MNLEDLNFSAVVNDLVKEDFLIFAKYELGLEISLPHLQWWDELKTGKDSIIMAPRDHGKSHMITRAYTAWRVKYDPCVKEVLLLGVDAPSAQENLDKFKEMMNEVESLKELLPTTKKGYNSVTKLILQNGVLIKSRSFFCQLRGRHPQLIILDDVLSEKNSLSGILREQVRNYFFGAVYPMKDKGTRKMRAQGFNAQIIVVGTAQSEFDLYHDLLKNNSFRGLKQSAIVDEDKKLSLWPDRYSWDDLMKIKKAVGSLMFAKEYCNEPIQDETSLFPVSLMKKMIDDTLNYQQEYDGENNVYMGVDFSIPGSTDGDYTVAVIAEDIGDGYLQILHVWRERPHTMREQITKIAELCKKFHVTIGYLEANLFQKVYSEYFKVYTDLPLQPHIVTATGKNSTETGLLSFRPLFEHRKFIFPYRSEYDRETTDLIITEFAGLIRKNGKLGNFRFHDDIIMASWHMLQASRTASFSFSF